MALVSRNGFSTPLVLLLGLLGQMKGIVSSLRNQSYKMFFPNMKRIVSSL